MLAKSAYCHSACPAIKTIAKKDQKVIMYITESRSEVYEGMADRARTAFGRLMIAQRAYAGWRSLQILRAHLRISLTAAKQRIDSCLKIPQNAPCYLRASQPVRSQRTVPCLFTSFGPRQQWLDIRTLGDHCTVSCFGTLAGRGTLRANGYAFPIEDGAGCVDRRSAGRTEMPTSPRFFTSAKP